MADPYLDIDALSSNPHGPGAGQAQLGRAWLRRELPDLEVVDARRLPGRRIGRLQCPVRGFSRKHIYIHRQSTGGHGRRTVQCVRESDWQKHRVGTNQAGSHVHVQQQRPTDVQSDHGVSRRRHGVEAAARSRIAGEAAAAEDRIWGRQRHVASPGWIQSRRQGRR